MLEFTKKMMLMGVGALAITQKKAETLKNDLIKQGELSEKEGKKFVEELLAKSKERQSELVEVMEKALKKLNIATYKDLERVEKKMDHVLKLLQTKK